jgi:hypothetical protein
MSDKKPRENLRRQQRKNKQAQREYQFAEARKLPPPSFKPVQTKNVAR